jgi:glycosyltransferase involved in cell wall biosynthesis
MLKNKTPSFTIVVPAFNEEEMIADCIASIQRQDYSGDFEIIVVDNASTDRTAEIARSMGVTVVKERKQGYVHALRAGFSAATQEIIACTDADTRVPEFWLTRISHTIHRQGVWQVQLPPRRREHGGLAQRVPRFRRV